jgi:Skp family chaperone for outer membrane proteins
MGNCANRFLAGPALALLVCGAFAAGPAPAQQAPEQNSYKIGFVDPDRVMRDARVSQQMQKTLTTEFEKRQRSIALTRGFELQDHALALYAACTKKSCEFRIKR